jgi:hypothetical protein
MHSASVSSAQNSLDWNVIYFKENIRDGTLLRQQMRRFCKDTVVWNSRNMLSHPNGSGIEKNIFLHTK